MQLDTVTLPDDFLWVNEFGWSPVAQRTERTLTGALVVHEAQQSYGAPLSLAMASIAGSPVISWRRCFCLVPSPIAACLSLYPMVVRSPSSLITVIVDRWKPILSHRQHSHPVKIITGW